MNRLAVGLAVGAGYVLGRTKKAKFAFAVGTMVAGKRLQLSPRALVSAVTQQLENNPQFKEIGDQLREDLRGVGKAATGSLVNRQMEGLADRLHERTLGVQDRLSGVLPGDAGQEDEEFADADAETDAEVDGSGPSGRDIESSGRDEAPRRQGKKAAAEKTAAPKSAAAPAARSTKPSARSAAEPPARKAPAKKTAQKRTAQQKTAAAARGTARRASSTARADRPKGDRDHG
ncbi:hypothetical protein [Streptomyces silaceus]|uniref:hypothetical protein n=1 Tax=Streptomyces silaceus TaxID=545123 RepID=UPI0006EBAAD9|nr:hypothetical protein [Streptomyces silaceus]